MTTLKKKENLQNVFLNELRKTKSSITIFLGNGVKLQGIITAFDNFSISLKRDTHYQLVYKHAIATVMPIKNIKLFDEEAEDEETQSEHCGVI